MGRVQELEPGMRVGDFELLYAIGKGGMGSVWLARVRRRAGFEKFFAIKTMLGDQSGDPLFRNMFLDEARVASAISHPNVVPIIDLGEQGDLFYIVMEWVEGESLQRVCRVHRTKMGSLCPLGVALRVLADACSGLHAAHELTDKDGASLEVVHRDVSPQNILLSTQGAIKVIDFGVAKARDRCSVETRSGSVKGKVRYMAPEQALGEKIDRRADVFGVGAVLYWLLTGKGPHEGETDLEILRGITTHAKLRDIPSSVPDPVAEILRRALAHAPEARYETAFELGQAIERAATRIGAVTSNFEVATLLRTVLADELEQDKRLRMQAIDRLDGAQPLSEPTGPAGSNRAPGSAAVARVSSAPTKLEQSSIEVEVTGTTLGSAAVDKPSHTTRRSRRFLVSIGVGAGALSLIGIGASLRELSPGTSDPAKARSASAAVAAEDVPFDTRDAGGLEPEKAAPAAASGPVASPIASVEAKRTKGKAVAPATTPSLPRIRRSDAGVRRSGPTTIDRVLDSPE